MQKLKLQNKWNDKTKSYDKNSFELNDRDSVITGKVSISSKQKDKFVNKPMPFILFKSKTDAQTQAAVKSGLPFQADFTLGVNEFTDKEGKTVTYHQLIINEARLEKADSHNSTKQNGYQPQQEEEEFDSEIPF